MRLRTTHHQSLSPQPLTFGIGLKCLFLVLCLVCILDVSVSSAAELEDIALPAPRQQGGKPLLDVLKNRQTVRAYSAEKLPMQLLSDLLWAAAGISRPDSGKRTAPSARNWQEVSVLVVLEEGTYLYDAKTNHLRGLAKGDLRTLTGKQDFVATAPVDLVFVADLNRIKGDVTDEDKALYSAVDTGFISQNVYLFCASEGLATVVRGSIDRKAFAEKLKLPPEQKVILAQTVGFPAPAVQSTHPAAASSSAPASASPSAPAVPAAK